VHARIARAAAPGPEDVVVEIGAGLGTLTAALAATDPAPRRILAIERDPDMQRVLRAELAADPRVVVRGEDAAGFDYRAAAAEAGRAVIVVGNLPYQITSALLFGIIEAGDAVARSVVMVQREVADRIVAPPGDKVYGRLSVMIGQLMDARLLFVVRPGSFYPPPKVTSAVLSLARRPAPLAPMRDPALFARVVKESFGTRRKMLRRSLGDAFGAETAARALVSAGVDGTRRPEELAIVEFARMADALGGAMPVEPPETLRFGMKKR